MYIYQKSVPKTVNGETVNCMTLNMIADPTCNQVDTGIEPDITCWREPAYGNVASKVYVHIKGDVDIEGNPLYISGDVAAGGYTGDDVNGVQLWMLDNELGSTLNVLFTEERNIDAATYPDGHIRCTGNAQGEAHLYIGDTHITSSIV